jgi:hypothetical protein
MWFLRRSVDLIPYMLFMAAREWVSGPQEFPQPPEWLPEADPEAEAVAETEVRWLSPVDDPEPVAE